MKRERARKNTDIAQVGLQLANTFVLWRVQDNGEFGKVLLGLHWILHPLLGDVADVDHFRGVVQEAAQAPQPRQVFFVFQLKTPNNFIPRSTELCFTKKEERRLCGSSVIPRW